MKPKRNLETKINVERCLGCANCTGKETADGCDLAKELAKNHYIYAASTLCAFARFEADFLTCKEELSIEGHPNPIGGARNSVRDRMCYLQSGVYASRKYDLENLEENEKLEFYGAIATALNTVGLLQYWDMFYYDNLEDKLHEYIKYMREEVNKALCVY